MFRTLDPQGVDLQLDGIVRKCVRRVYHRPVLRTNIVAGVEDWNNALFAEAVATGRLIGRLETAQTDWTLEVVRKNVDEEVLVHVFFILGHF